MARIMLPAGLWERLEPLLPGAGKGVRNRFSYWFLTPFTLDSFYALVAAP